jgi:hypothetical protein
VNNYPEFIPYTEFPYIISENKGTNPKIFHYEKVTVLIPNFILMSNIFIVLLIKNIVQDVELFENNNRNLRKHTKYGVIKND